MYACGPIARLLLGAFAAGCLAGCIAEEQPLPPGEAAALAAQRVERILEEARPAAERPPAIEPPAEPEDPFEVRFWHYRHPFMDLLDARAPVAADFQRRYPNVRLRTQFIGEWPVAVQKLTVTLAAGELPDVAVVKRAWFARVLPSGRLAPLDTLLPPSLIEDLRPGFRDAFSLDGRLYGLPADGFVSVLFYNRELVAEAPATWDALRAAADTLMRASPEAVEAPIGYLPYLELLWSAGGSLAASATDGLTEAEAEETLTFLLELRDAGLLHADAMARPGIALELFRRGRVAMTVASSEHWPRFANAGFRVGMAPVPGKYAPVSRAGEDVVVVFRKHADAKREALTAFLDFLTGSGVLGAEAARRGSAPVRSSAADAAASPPGLEAAAAHGRAAPLVPVWSAIEYEATRILGRAYRWRPEPAE